jgi:calcineurin-like phosphoesterase family protein
MKPQLYVTADTHFNHAGILRHVPSRPWRTVKEMNAALVERWNAVVLNESDVVYHLGDFGMHAPNDGDASDLGVLFWQLRGRKHLVVGNHDVKNPQVLRLPWESIDQIAEVKRDGRRLVLCHYPLESWPGMHHGAAHVHGHSHGTLARKAPKRFDVGVDVFPAPVSWEELWEMADRETFVPADHHSYSLDEPAA